MKKVLCILICIIMTITFTLTYSVYGETLKENLEEKRDELSNQIDNSFILLANTKEDDSVNFIAKSTSNRIDWGSIIKDLAVNCSGNGGGSKTFAQGGGTDASNIVKLLAQIKEKIKKL